MRPTAKSSSHGTERGFCGPWHPPRLRFLSSIWRVRTRIAAAMSPNLVREHIPQPLADEKEEEYLSALVLLQESEVDGPEQVSSEADEQVFSEARFVEQFWSASVAAEPSLSLASL